MEVVKICINGHDTNCGKVGYKNNIGVTKSYCCPCFAKLDSNFKFDDWCYNCDPREEIITHEDYAYATSGRYHRLYKNQKHNS